MSEKMRKKPNTAMVLAAGLGNRMRPITDTMPKPLVKVFGKTLLDYGLDALTRANVEKAVVNIHYLADQMEAHLESRTQPKICISDEYFTNSRRLKANDLCKLDQPAAGGSL